MNKITDEAEPKGMYSTQYLAENTSFKHPVYLNCMH